MSGTKPYGFQNVLVRSASNIYNPVFLFKIETFNINEHLIRNSKTGEQQHNRECETVSLNS